MDTLFSLNHFVHGCIAGMVGVTISHPFDTIKTCIQNKKSFEYNRKFLYRGFTAPLFGVGFEKAVVFGTYTNTSKYLPIPIAGLVAGLMASLVVTPIERIKILLQTNNNISKKRLSSSFLYQGLSATLTRETPGFSIYFSFYEYMKTRLYTSKNKQITLLGSFILGGGAGLVAWLFIFPQDLIKTRIQSSLTKTNFVTIANEIRKESGIFGFYKGFHFAIMRAVPLHAGTFAAMELLKSIDN